MPTHELNLRDNALDSLREALAKFEEGDGGDLKAYKFAVQHMSHFVELIFKDHLATIHPLLIYKDPFSRKLNAEKTIGLWDALNFIANESPDNISAEFRSDLEWMKKLRNDIEHHKFSLDVQQTRQTLKVTRKKPLKCWLTSTRWRGVMPFKLQTSSRMSILRIIRPTLMLLPHALSVSTAEILHA